MRRDHGLVPVDGGQGPQAGFGRPGRDLKEFWDGEPIFEKVGYYRASRWDWGRRQEAGVREG